MVDGSPVPPPGPKAPPIPVDPSQGQAEQSTQQAQQQQQAAQEMKNAAKEAERGPGLHGGVKGGPLGLPGQLPPSGESAKAHAAEALNIFDTFFGESLENFQAKGAGDSSLTSNKELGTIREFSRELTRLVRDQGMTMAQALRMIKTMQGGSFWQRVQKILNQGQLFQQGMPQKKPGEQTAQKGAAGPGGDGMANPGEAGLQNPGRAVLEMIQAESNPLGEVEHMALALLILKQEGMEKSSDKLMSHLRNRWGMSEDEMQKFLSKYPIAFFQGPMPRKQEKEKATLWYLMAAVVSVPVSMSLGLNLVNALITGIMATVLLLALSLTTRK